MKLHCTQFAELIKFLFLFEGKSLKITLKKSPRKKSGKKKNKASSSTKITEENDDCFTCVDCSYVSTKKMNLREHIQRMHKDKVWSCEFCSKIFSIQKEIVYNVASSYLTRQFYT
jgi:Zn-finger protein